MSRLAPKTVGYYPNYRFPRSLGFTLEEGNQEIRDRQLEMIDLYNALHHDMGVWITVNGSGQFNNRSDNLRERLLMATSDVKASRTAVVEALTHIILLGGTPPPPRRDVDDDVLELLGLARLLPAAYTAAGVPAPAPPPASQPNPPAPQLNPPQPNPPAPQPNPPQPNPPAPQPNPPAARPRARTMPPPRYPSRNPQQARPLRREQQQDNPIQAGQTEREQALALQAEFASYHSDEEQTEDLEAQHPHPTQTQLQLAHSTQAGVGDGTSSSGRRLSMQAQMRREQQQDNPIQAGQTKREQALALLEEFASYLSDEEQMEDLEAQHPHPTQTQLQLAHSTQAGVGDGTSSSGRRLSLQDHQAQQPAPTQAPPQPAHPTQEAPARKKNVQDGTSSSGSRGQGR